MTNQNNDLNDNTPTEITREDIENVLKKFEDGFFEIKSSICFSCGKEHLPNYGYITSECDECYFKRFPADVRKAFFMDIINSIL